MSYEPVTEIETLAMLAVRVDGDMRQVRHRRQQVHRECEHHGAFRQNVLDPSLASADAVWRRVAQGHQIIKHVRSSTLAV